MSRFWRSHARANAEPQVRDLNNAANAFDLRLPAGFDAVAINIHRWKPVPRRQRDDRITLLVV